MYTFIDLQLYVQDNTTAQPWPTHTHPVQRATIDLTYTSCDG